MAMSKTHNAKPMNRPGQDATTKDRGMSQYFDMRNQPNKAKVQDGRQVMMENAPAQHRKLTSYVN
jgi:hypothetical protein